jgi:ATP-dependent DNA ligase
MVSWIRQDKKPEDSTTVKEIIQMYNMQKHAKTE